MPSVTVKQIQKLDATAIDRYGVPSLALMESAGAAVGREVVQILRRKRARSAVVVCGLGNNAGDGFVVARHLMNAGVRVKIFLIGRGARLKHDAAVNYRILKKLKHPVREIKKADAAFEGALGRAGVVVDAIFGVGLNRTVGGTFCDVIGAVNRRAQYIVAVDVPSGLDATTGKIYGACVRANTTVTFSLAKKGFSIGDGPRCAGKVIVADIGIPVKLVRKIGR